MAESSLRGELQTYFLRKRKQVDESLDRLLPAADQFPVSIHQAMRYSVFAGGKRVRPILALATREALCGPLPCVLRLASCLEMIHAYSLIHDDLPALDNDDFRRGRPTVHRKYSEGVAILAGNALMSHAFKLLTGLPEDDVAPTVALAVINSLCEAIGTLEGMISGQVVDLLAAGKEYSEADLHYIHCSKTAALIRASITTAALLCRSSTAILQSLSSFGTSIGLVFQIVDDILDVEASSADLGKTAGKDVLAEKATYPAMYGLAESRRIKNDLLQRALVELEVVGESGERLRQIAHFIANRGH